MPMDETTIKTNLGLILQAILAKAIENAGFTAIQNFQYEVTCEKPDFLIPDAKKPRFIVEVHQTEARDSFRMKTLRAFTAVTESKAYFGDELISVNVLFGNPEIELPASNLRALCGVFDVNLIPRLHAPNRPSVVQLEKMALSYASDEDYRNKTALAAKELISSNEGAISTLSEMMADALGAAVVRTELFPVWQAERVRVKTLAPPPKAGQPTYFKRGLLGSVFLSDQQFLELLNAKSPTHCCAETRAQLLAVKLATIEEQIDGDELTLDSQFEVFLRDPNSARLRYLCLADLNGNPDVSWFFEDIRNAERRLEMAGIFLAEVKKGPASFRKAMAQSFRSDNAFGIMHRRCWFADLMPLLVGKSHNFFNRSIYRDPRYSVSLGNPYNNITIRSARLGKDETVLCLLEELSCDVFFAAIRDDEIDVEQVTAKDLADSLLKFRVAAAIKLRKLDPLLLVAADIAAEYGLAIEVEGLSTAISDLAHTGGVGRFRVAILSDDQGRRILLNAVAAHDQNGDHKSKEWGARRLASLYRLENLQVSTSSFVDGLFILDGEWEDKYVARLYRSGWNHICRLGDLDATLKNIFGLRGKALVKKAKGAQLVFASGEGDEDL